MISKYLLFVSSTKSQIIIFILLNICGLIFFFLPYSIFSNMLDLQFSYNEDIVLKFLNEMGPDGRSIYVFSSLLLDTLYPILYTSLILGAYVKLFKNSQAILILPLIAFSFDILENIQITMLNLNFPDINDTQVYLSSMATSAKWIAILVVFLTLIYGIVKKKKK